MLIEEIKPAASRCTWDTPMSSNHEIEALSFASAAGNSGRNATLKNIGAKNFLNKCSFCKYCRRTRRGNGKGAKSAVTSAAGRSPGRNSGNAAGAASAAGAPNEENGSQNI
jgi:hypothetical protein